MNKTIIPAFLSGLSLVLMFAGCTGKSPKNSEVSPVNPEDNALAGITAEENHTYLLLNDGNTIVEIDKRLKDRRIGDVTEIRSFNFKTEKIEIQSPLDQSPIGVNDEPTLSKTGTATLAFSDRVIESADARTNGCWLAGLVIHLEKDSAPEQARAFQKNYCP